MSSYTSELMAKVMDSSGITFTISDTELTMDQVFSNDGALPLLAYAADRMCQQHLGIPLGIEVSPKDEALYGVTVEFSESTPVSSQLLFLVESTAAYCRKELGLDLNSIQDGMEDLRGKTIALDNLADYLHQLAPEISIEDFFTAGKTANQPVQPSV